MTRASNFELDSETHLPLPASLKKTTAPEIVFFPVQHNKEEKTRTHADILTLIFDHNAQTYEFQIFSHEFFKPIENFFNPGSSTIEKLKKNLEENQRMTLAKLRSYFSAAQKPKLMLLMASILKSYAKSEYLPADRDRANRTLRALYQEMIDKKHLTLMTLESDTLKNPHVSFSHRFYSHVIFIVAPNANVKFFDCHFDHCHFDAPNTADKEMLILENCQLNSTKFYGDCQKIKITGSRKSSKLERCHFEDTLTLPHIDEKISLGASTFSDKQLIALCRQQTIPAPATTNRKNFIGFLKLKWKKIL